MQGGSRRERQTRVGTAPGLICSFGVTRFGLARPRGGIHFPRWQARSIRCSLSMLRIGQADAVKKSDEAAEN